MSRSIITAIAGVVLISVLSGCSIVSKIDPAPAGTKVGTIYVQKNKNVHMSGLHDELIAQLRGLGYSAATFEGDRPKDAVHMLSYTANWRWDMAMYLTYFQATLLEDSKVLGRLEYDATHGGGRPDKFGKTAEKIRPLLIDLLQNVQKGSPGGAVLGGTAQKG